MIRRLFTWTVNYKNMKKRVLSSHLKFRQITKKNIGNNWPEKEWSGLASLQESRRGEPELGS